LDTVFVWDSFAKEVELDISVSSSVVFAEGFCGNVSIKQLRQENRLSIYPNPTNTLLTIETEHPNHYSIEMTSLNGQLIYNAYMEGTTHQIDLSSFQKGVYFITIRSEDFVTTRKVIKL
jgi:hypothetical protein